LYTQISCLRESVAVIPVAHLFEHFARRAASLRSHVLDVRREVLFQFVLSIAQHVGVPGIHRQVHQIVQVGEDRDTAELTNAGQQREADVLVARLDDRIEGFQDSQDLADGRVLDIAQDRLVVLVDQDDHLPVPAERRDQRLEKVMRFVCRQFDAVPPRGLFDSQTQAMFQPAVSQACLLPRSMRMTGYGFQS
jgi:hypothetical protein